jgi:hypothetical protein
MRYNKMKNISQSHLIFEMRNTEDDLRRCSACHVDLPKHRFNSTHRTCVQCIRRKQQTRDTISAINSIADDFIICTKCHSVEYDREHRRCKYCREKIPFTQRDTDMRKELCNRCGKNLRVSKMIDGTCASCWLEIH